MATAEEYAAWIVANKDKRGTPEFDTVARAYQVARGQSAAPAPTPAAQPQERNRFQETALGVARGVADVGDTLINVATKPVRMISPAVEQWNQGRRQSLGMLDAENADSNFYAGGRLAGNVAAAAPVGGVLAAGARAAGAAPAITEALATGGFRAAGATGVPGAAVRATGGAATGAASAGLVNPEDAVAGGAIGALLPGALKVAGAAGRAAGRAFAGGPVSQDVAALANRAAQLGIEVPADRIANSKPMNAVASALNYVPFSGRAAVEQRMQDQFNRAITRTFGQNSENVTKALRQARGQLGAEFDRALTRGVNFDLQLLQDLGGIQQTAAKELGADGLRVIDNQINELVLKGGNGTVDGQAAYNIKRMLDRISDRNTPEAFHAREMKKALMAALERSMSPQEAAAFRTTRQRYGNMLDLEGLAQNGADGDISIARVANMRDLNNPDLQELADIAAQFLKPREGQHGAAQRAAAGAVAAFTGGLPALAGGAALGRGTNALLDSPALRNRLLNGPAPPGIGLNALEQIARRAPVAIPASQQ